MYDAVKLNESRAANVSATPYDSLTSEQQSIFTRMVGSSPYSADGSLPGSYPDYVRVNDTYRIEDGVYEVRATGWWDACL